MVDPESVFGLVLPEVGYWHKIRYNHHMRGASSTSSNGLLFGARKAMQHKQVELAPLIENVYVDTQNLDNWVKVGQNETHKTLFVAPVVGQLVEIETAYIISNINDHLAHIKRYGDEEFGEDFGDKLEDVLEKLSGKYSKLKTTHCSSRAVSKDGRFSQAMSDKDSIAFEIFPGHSITPPKKHIKLTEVPYAYDYQVYRFSSSVLPRPLAEGESLRLVKDFEPGKVFFVKVAPTLELLEDISKEPLEVQTVFEKAYQNKTSVEIPAFINKAREIEVRGQTLYAVADDDQVLLDIDFALEGTIDAGVKDIYLSLRANKAQFAVFSAESLDFEVISDFVEKGLTLPRMEK